MISSRSCETCIVFILLLVRKLIFFDIKILTLKNKNKLAQSAKVLIQIRWKLLEEKTRVNYKINTRRKVLRHFPIRPNICIKLRIYWLYYILSERRSHQTMFVPTPQESLSYFTKLYWTSSWHKCKKWQDTTVKTFNRITHSSQPLLKTRRAGFILIIYFEKAEFKDNIGLAWKLSAFLLIGEPSSTNGYFGAVVELASCLSCPV